MLVTAVHETVAQTLKHRTENNHRTLEELLLPVLRAIHTCDDYTALLKAFYVDFKPVEEAIFQYVNERVLPDIQHRRKADYLLKDLSFLHQPPQHLPLATEVPVITHLYQAMGALYVLEGSTLGGRSITRMLQRLGTAAAPRRL